jgi:TPR repeat protein/serine/threonine protein kinase
MKDPRYPFALDLGSEVGGYRIEAILGAGGFGITYRAFNEITQKTVAIKEFYVRDISSRTGQTVAVDTDISEGTYEYALKKFQEEAQVVVSRFSHPYIIKGENFIKENNTSYVIMEYIDGESLEEWMARRPEPPSEAEIRPIFEKLFSAIDYVHSQNTMHRDITPRNIMLRRNGDPVLIDFGAAGHGIDLGRSSKIVAQLRYAPPEQQDDTGPGIHGRYTDIFSLGGVMYRTVTGRPPTAPATRMAKLARREPDPHVPAHQAVRDPSLYSDAFLDGIDQALRLDERERPASIDVFRQLLGWSGGLPAPAPAPDYEDHTVAIRRDESQTMFVGDEGSSLAGSGLRRAEVERRGGALPAAEPLALPPQPFIPPKPERQTTGIRFNTATPKPRTGYVPTPPPQAPEPPPAPVVERRSRAKPLVFGAVATIVALGGIAYAVPLIMRSRTAEVVTPQVVSPFTLTASIDNGTLSLVGYAPNEQARATILAAARSVPGARVDDRLQIADGAPVGFADRAVLAIGRIGGFSRGTVNLVNDRVTFDGTAASPEVYQTLQQDLARMELPGGGRPDVTVRPARVAQFGFTAEVGRDAIQLSGFVPSADTRLRLKSIGDRTLQGLAWRDQTQVADGAPSGFIEATSTFLPRLADLSDGRMVVNDGEILIEGRARSADAYQRATNLAGTAVPGNLKLTVNVKPPLVSPYDWSAVFDGQSIVLRGNAPSAEVKADLLRAAGQIQANTPARDESNIADGAPADFATAARFALDVLPRLARGRVAITGDTIAIEGAARNPADYAALSRSLQQNVPAGFKLVQSTVDAPRISPYPFAVQMGSAGPRLTGFVPSDATRRDILASAQSLLGGRPVDETQLGDGAPDGFANAAKFAIGQAARLAAGRVALEDRNLTIEGTIRTLDDLKPLKEANRTGLPTGVTLVRASVGSRADVAATDCDRQALPEDHPDKPAGESGIDLAQIDAVKAIAACQQALQSYPNVRRFATALGQGFLRRGQYPDAQREFRRAIEADDPSAMNILAGLLREGIGLPADPVAAFDLYTRAANLGSPSATHALGWIYENGIGRVADPIRAAEFYTKGAALGVADSYAQLGWLSQNGIGRRADYARAYDNYERGARLGSTLAMHQLGYMNEVGLGRPADLGKAFEWYSRAAELGRGDSMVKLGQFYLDGIGRQVDYAKATQWFEKAAALGNSSGMHQLGSILFEGLGRKADPAAGIAWLEKAAALGRAESMQYLGFAYQTGTGVAQDYAKAFDWYQKGARLNDAASIYQIGWLYENALGRPVDYAKAIEWYMRAALLGYARAMYQIGVLYENGRGRPTDLAKAIEWYQRAAELNDPTALNRLGWMAEKGIGRAKSDADALVWYEKAVAAGSSTAMWNAAILYNDGRGAAADPDKAANLLLMAFLRHQPNAVDLLSGDLSGVSEDTRKAIQRNLQKRGLYRGAIDGLFNQETRRAVLSLPGGLSN